MKMMKKMVDEADDMLIDDLVGKCESKMVGPLKKEKVEIAMDPEDGMESKDHEMGESDGEETAENSLDPEDMQKLLDFYEQLKG
jgi:hypothetical protein